MNNVHAQDSEELDSLPPFTTENLNPNFFLRDTELKWIVFAAVYLA